MIEVIDILLLSLSIIVHEIGHYIAYRLFKKSPDIKIKWYGILIGNNIWHKLKPFEAYVITISGIFMGSLVVMNNETLLLVYLIMCSIDITNIISLFDVRREHKDLTLLEINKLQLKELEAGR